MTTPIVVANADPTNLMIGPQIQQVCPRLGQGQTAIIYNNDLTNIAQIGYRNAGMTASNSVAVQPLSTVVLDASRALFGFCSTATISITVVPNGVNINPSPSQIAEQIASSGIPLLTGETNVIDNGAAIPVVAQGASKMYSASVTRPGYIITINPWNATNTTTQLPLSILTEWVDAGGVVIDRQKWWVYAGTTAIPHVIVGSGPTKGLTLNITVTNRASSAVNLSFHLIVDETTFAYERHDWRTDDQNGFTLAGWNTSPNILPQALDMLGDMMAITTGAQAIAASGQVNVIMPLYNGPTMMNFNSSGAVGALGINIASAADNNGPNGNPFSIVQPGAANSAFFPNFPVYLPRSQCSIQLFNTTAGAINGFYNVYVAER